MTSEIHNKEEKKKNPQNNNLEIFWLLLNAFSWADRNFIWMILDRETGGHIT